MSRIFGMAGAAELDDGGMRVLTVARGFCQLHRDGVPRLFRSEPELLGGVLWLSDPYVRVAA